MQFLSHTTHISNALRPHMAGGCPRRQCRHRAIHCLQKVLMDSTALDGNTDIDHEADGAPWSCAMEQSWSSDPATSCLGLPACRVTACAKFLSNISKGIGFFHPSPEPICTFCPFYLTIFCQPSSSWMFFRK